MIMSKIVKVADPDFEALSSLWGGKLKRYKCLDCQFIWTDHKSISDTECPRCKRDPIGLLKLSDFPPQDRETK